MMAAAACARHTLRTTREEAEEAPQPKDRIQPARPRSLSTSGSQSKQWQQHAQSHTRRSCRTTGRGEPRVQSGGLQPCNTEEQPADRNCDPASCGPSDREERQRVRSFSASPPGLGTSVAARCSSESCACTSCGLELGLLGQSAGANGSLRSGLPVQRGEASRATCPGRIAAKPYRSCV